MKNFGFLTILLGLGGICLTYFSSLLIQKFSGSSAAGRSWNEFSLIRRRHRRNHAGDGVDQHQKQIQFLLEEIRSTLNNMVHDATPAAPDFPNHLLVSKGIMRDVQLNLVTLEEKINMLIFPSSSTTSNITATATTAANVQPFSSYRNFDTSITSNNSSHVLLKSTSDGAMRRKYGVVGILSSSNPDNQYMRMAQRYTWVKDAAAYNIKVYFLIDQEPDQENSFLAEESKIYGDIVNLGATYTGRAIRFGQKLHLWYKKALSMHPDAAFVAKVDDDCVVCTHVMWPFVWDKITPMAYLGWMHSYEEYTQWQQQQSDNSTRIPFHLGKKSRMDEFFVAIGSKLVKILANTEYCDDEDENVCITGNKLYDTNYGGTSLGKWLEPYEGALDIITLNGISPHPKIHKVPQKKVLNFTCSGKISHVHPVKNPHAFLPIYQA